ncbi:MAG: nucleotidyltransferase family protein [Lachnospiraceae bacterium]|nr:nucleotidyltransferase family protein [Lachnospiraceae bacterium]
MPKLYFLFLSVLRCAIRNAPVPEHLECSEKEWSDLFYLASKHDVQPLIMNVLYKCNSLCQYSDLYDEMMRYARKVTIFQAAHTADFLLLYKEMNKAGLYPLVLKGLICRNLYETPELRFSVDEDLFIKADDIQIYNDFLCNHGFVLADETMDIQSAYEVSYHNQDSGLYLEVHKHLFPPEDSAYGYLNHLFNDLDGSITIKIYGTNIHTLNYTDHFLYLITHAFKHIIYSGIGIRQICDIALFAETYGKYIDWSNVLSLCTEYHLNTFLYAVLIICKKYYDMDISCISFPLQDIDEKPLLLDILSGGTYGAADENRLHSATMTLRAVSAEQNEVKSNGILRSLFPDASYMKQKYPYLKQHEWLLPAAWGQRIFEYAVHRNKKTNPVKSIEIGKKRIELLKTYGILK